MTGDRGVRGTCVWILTADAVALLVLTTGHLVLEVENIDHTLLELGLLGGSTALVFGGARKTPVPEM